MYRRKMTRKFNTEHKQEFKVHLVSIIELDKTAKGVRPNRTQIYKTQIPTKKDHCIFLSEI